MTDIPTSEVRSPEQYREYLILLARTNRNPLLNGRVDASDIVQTSLLLAFEKRHQFRGTSEPEYRAWLRAILANQYAESIRHHRRQRRDTTLLLSIDRDFIACETTAAYWLASHARSPSSLAIGRDEILRLANALSKLPDDQRQAIEIHHLQRLSLLETAQVMKRSRESVAGLLFRAMRNLRKQLNVEEG